MTVTLYINFRRFYIQSFIFKSKQKKNIWVSDTLLIGGKEKKKKES